MNNRILIAGTNSGCGKTTVTLAVLSALKKRNVKLASFKCGPDYIDPMFHRKVLEIPSYNLDSFFCAKEQLCERLGSVKDTFSVIEGVMGYYDGVGVNGEFSTYTVAKETATPVIIVINVKGMCTSAGAVMRGFTAYRENSGIKGVIFNGASAMLYPMLKEIAQAEGLIPLGYLPYDECVSVGSRHLGLVTAAEIDDLQSRIERLAKLAQTSLDIDGIIDLGAKAVNLPCPTEKQKAIETVTVAVARDKAFCFIYEENLELMRQLGCRLLFFSPLNDKKLPDGISGLYLPGGYPELYKAELSENKTMLKSVKDCIKSGMPTIAECGGFLYLHQTVDEIPMAGVINAKAFKTNKLQRFGYITLTAENENLLCKKGESIKGHEFHYYESSDCGKAYIVQKPNKGKVYSAVHANENMYAGFPHLYFHSNPEFIENFIRKAEQYGIERNNEAN